MKKTLTMVMILTMALAFGCGNSCKDCGKTDAVAPDATIEVVEFDAAMVPDVLPLVEDAVVLIDVAPAVD